MWGAACAVRVIYPLSPTFSDKEESSISLTGAFLLSEVSIESSVRVEPYQSERCVFFPVMLCSSENFT